MKMLTARDVDNEQLSADLRQLADEIETVDVSIEQVSTSHAFESGDSERVKISVTLSPLSNSIFSGGYNIPADN